MPLHHRNLGRRMCVGRGDEGSTPASLRHLKCTAHRRFRSRLSSTVTGTLVPERSSLPWRFPGGNGGHKRAVVGCLERLLGTDAHPRIARVAPAQEAARRRRGPLRRQRLGGWMGGGGGWTEVAGSGFVTRFRSTTPLEPSRPGFGRLGTFRGLRGHVPDRLATWVQGGAQAVHLCVRLA